MPNCIVKPDRFLLSIFVSNLMLIEDFLLSFWVNRVDYSFGPIEVKEDHVDYVTTINPLYSSHIENEL